MSNSLNPVFGEWYTDKQLGSGTDGKVFSIYRTKPDGTRENSILKIIRLGENRNERAPKAENEEQQSLNYEEIIRKIKRNIITVKKLDKGRNIVNYEALEVRDASDKKGKLVLIKLQEMRSLSQLLEEFSFTYEETVRLGLSVCKGLIKCREFNYTYPNLKPENILFDRDGVCKLGDLGSFSCLEPSKSSIAYKRTQYYMAPEFIKTGKVSKTADTYSLGLVLYMLTNRGRLPFIEPYPQKLTVNSFNEATARRMKGESFKKPVLCSEKLWQIISKACAFNPADRYASPNEMYADLKKLLMTTSFDENIKYDVYSERVEDESQVMVPTFEEGGYSDPFGDDLGEEWIAPDLKSEINIPDWIPMYKRQKAKRKPANYEKLPEIKKKKVVKKDWEAIKQLITYALIALALVILFIACLVMRFSPDEPTLTTLSCVIGESYYNFLLLLN